MPLGRPCGATGNLMLNASSGATSATGSWSGWPETKRAEAATRIGQRIGKHAGADRTQRRFHFEKGACGLPAGDHDGRRRILEQGIEVRWQRAAARAAPPLRRAWRTPRRRRAARCNWAARSPPGRPFDTGTTQCVRQPVHPLVELAPTEALILEHHCSAIGDSAHGAR